MAIDWLKVKGLVIRMDSKMLIKMDLSLTIMMETTMDSSLVIMTVKGLVKAKRLRKATVTH